MLSTPVHAQKNTAITYTLPNAVTWEPQVSYISVTLNVSGPGGDVTSQVFSSEQEPIFVVNGHADGSYTYELIFQTVQAIGERDDSGQDGLGESPSAPSYSGAFSIVSGSIVQGTEGGDETSGGDDIDDGLGTRDQVILDDLIVDGSACIGFDCVNGESFGFDTLRLKENNIRITFIDTSSGSSFPSNDWQITANDSSDGGLDKFSIDDITGGKTPFTIEAGAPSHSLYVDDAGRLGLGTNTPVADAHMKSGNTPTLRLEQDGSSGFTPQIWDVAGNEANFFIRDSTNGSTLPFRIFPGALSNAMTIRGVDPYKGFVGLGLTAPEARLHLKALDGEDVGIILEDYAGNEWRVGLNNLNGTMVLSKGDIPALTIDPKTYVLTASRGIISNGTIVHASDRNLKTDFKETDTEMVLNKVIEMPLTTWRFKTEESTVRHLGPTSQDFKAAFDLGDSSDRYINTGDADGVAFAAIQGLNQKLLKSLAERDVIIADLQVRLEALEKVAE